MYVAMRTQEFTRLCFSRSF